MRRAVPCLIAMLVLLSIVGSSGDARPARTSRQTCPPRYADVIEADAQAIVYLLRVASPGQAGVSFGCVRGENRSYALDRLECRFAVNQCGQDIESKLAGSVVASSESETAVGVGRSGDRHGFVLVVRDLRDDRVLHAVPRGGASGHAPGIRGMRLVPSVVLLVPHGAVTQQALVLKPDGAVAWVTEATKKLPSHRTYYELHALDSSGSRRLAAGSALDPYSLRLRGSTLTWTRGGERRSATLD
jgi:hypothetical protein